MERRSFIAHLLWIASLFVWRIKPSAPSAVVEGPWWRLGPDGVFHSATNPKAEIKANELVLAAQDGGFRLLHYTHPDRSHLADKNCLSIFPCHDDQPNFSSRICGPVVRSGEIIVGLLLEPLLPGRKAKVAHYNPYYPDWGPIVWEVNAGPLVHSCGWPVGSPVAFASINNRMETVGW